MPRDKDRKRIIRARMEKTGESYTTARRHILDKASAKEPEPGPQPESYAATAGMSDDTVSARTGRTWAEWVAVLDAHDAAALPHGEIATLVKERYGVSDWWTQMVTVGYERIRGLRDRGQRRGGTYEAGRSRTYGVDARALFDACADEVMRRRWLTDQEPTVRTARSPKSLRLQWPDGTIVALWFTPKGPAKCSVAVQHTGLPDRAAVDRVKQEWGARLDALGALLAG